MEDSAHQLDFNDELETLEMKEEIWWKTLINQIWQVDPNGYFSDQTICANLMAWSIYFRQHAYDHLLSAIEQEELPTNKTEYLKVLIESHSISQWVDQQPEVSSDVENPWGDLEPIRHVAERCKLAELAVVFADHCRDKRGYLPVYLKELDEELFQAEFVSQIKIYYPGKEQRIAEKRKSRKEYLRQLKLKEIEYERRKKSEFGVGIFFGMIIGCFLTLVLIFGVLLSN